jgi:hypothetical protein
MTTLAKKRIKNVFKNTLKNVSLGKPANVKGEMIKQGYSLSSAACQKVKKTKTWQALLDTINDDKIVNQLKNIALSAEDKRACLKAIDIILKLKDKYPQQTSKVMGLFKNI